MSEAERLRAQAGRCAQLAREAKNKDVADALVKLANKSLDQAANLERESIKRRQIHSNRDG